MTTKGDVYSYGIMLLELLTGKKPTDNMFVEGMTLRKWVISGFPDQVTEAVDRNLLRRTSMTNTEEDTRLYHSTHKFRFVLHNRISFRTT